MKHDPNKIRLMAQMALYDKKGFQKDAEANEYFRHDFIYKKNMSMRFYVGIGILILVVFYALRMLAVDQVDIFALDFQAELMRIIIFAVVVMLIYSFIGTILFTREFLLSQKRVKAYFALMRELHGEADEEEVAAVKEPAPKRLFARKAATTPPPQPEEEEEPFIFRPYRSRQADGNLTYNYRSTDDPSLWEDEDDEKK
ncbi:MAG: hypothetical protein FWE21_09740 [Defluviitaleaceae bacterium]|nr:hypothetical protein [Defluviitaleaceae bacterium]